MDSAPWWHIGNADSVPSPALVIHSERLHENIRRMIAIAGDPARLRPHIKTCKIPQVARIQLEQGIRKFKCATIAEAEMLAQAGAPDVLLAYQPVGPHIDRFIRLVQSHPNTRFSTVVDAADSITRIQSAAAATRIRIPLWLDIDCGMHRTGIAPGPEAVALWRSIADHPWTEAAGLHAYDGHLHQADRETRRAACESAFGPVRALAAHLTRAGLTVPAIVAGGTPTFPVHALDPALELSPGTCVFWDAGYATKLPDLDFLPAVFLLTRVVSKPAPHRLCLDLGHKAVAAEMPHPRAVLLEIPDAQAVMHSEEHLVVETTEAARYPIGATLHALPWHVCPTVALHAEAWILEKGQAVATWPVTARARRLSI